MDLVCIDDAILSSLRQKALEFSRVINNLNSASQAPYFEVSALTGKDVNKAFEFIFNTLDPENYENKRQLEESLLRSGGTSYEYSTNVDSTNEGNKRPSVDTVIKLGKNPKQKNGRQKCSLSC